MIVSGDFNQRDIAEALTNYPYITELDLGPTRGSRCINSVFTNFAESVEKCETLPQLESKDSSKKNVTI